MASTFRSAFAVVFFFVLSFAVCPSAFAADADSSLQSEAASGCTGETLEQMREFLIDGQYISIEFDLDPETGDLIPIPIEYDCGKRKRNNCRPNKASNCGKKKKCKQNPNWNEESRTETPCSCQS